MVWIPKQVYRVRISFLTDTLGLSPSNSEVYQRYVKKRLYEEIEKLEKMLRKKKLTDEEREILERRLERLRADSEVEEFMPEVSDRLSVFARDREGYLIFKNYQILGYFKEIANNFYKGGLRNKISKYVDIYGDIVKDIYREVYFERDGERLTQPDDLLERPLRAYTPSGYVVSIVISEVLRPPLEVQFDIKVVGSKSLHDITGDLLREMLEYGKEISGLSQWRTAGWGKFEVKEFYELDLDNPELNGDKPKRVKLKKNG